MLSKENTSQDKTQIETKNLTKWENHCKTAITNSCSDLAILIEMPGTYPGVKYTTKQTDTRGTIATKFSSPLVGGGTITSTIGQTTYGPDGEIELHNTVDDIKFKVSYQQNYCSTESGTITIFAKTSGSNTMDTVSISCSEYEGDYWDDHSGCVKCKIETPEYKGLELQTEFAGESTSCVWQNKTKIPKVSKQRCFPYVKYFSRDERMKLKLSVKHGLVYNASGDLYDTTFADEVHTTRGGIYVMGFDGALYASNAFHVGLLHHSSIFAGGPVASAGEIVVKKGVISLMTNCSGHYKPSPVNLQQAIASLKLQGYRSEIETRLCSSSDLIRDLDYNLTLKK